MGAVRRGRARGQVRFLLAIGAILAFSTAARAEEPPSEASEAAAAPWLSWSPPPECPRADFVLDRVRTWLNGQLPPAGELEARGEVQWTGTEWEVLVAIRVGVAVGERRVRVATCGDAAEFLAVTIVLAIEPERGPELTRAVDPPAAASVAPALEIEAAAAAVQEVRVDPVEREASSGPPPEPPARPVSWLLGASVEGALGALPNFQVGPAVELGLQYGPLVVTAGARLLPPVTQTPPGAVGDISYSLAAGRVGACLLGDFGFTSFGPCAAVDVGALWTQQAAPGDISQTVPWVDLQAGAGARFFGPRVSLALGARLSVPVTQPLFVVSSGETVHQPTPGVVLDLGLQVFFGPR